MTSRREYFMQNPGSLRDFLKSHSGKESSVPRDNLASYMCSNMNCERCPAAQYEACECEDRLGNWLDDSFGGDLSDLDPEDREAVQKILDAAMKSAKEEKVMYSPEGTAEFKEFNVSDVVPPRADGAETAKKTPDEIRPDWYKITPEIEAWDVINPILNRCDYTGECIGYLKDILKYVLRADRKNGLEDYKKAYTNLKQLIKVLEEG